MRVRTALLRTAYWVGAIADAFAAIRLLLVPFRPSITYAPEMETVASLMIGWTILLIWADRKPLERKFVLLLTVVMMTIGRLFDVAVVVAGKATAMDVLTNTAPALALLVLFAVIYLVCARGQTPMEGVDKATNS